MNLIMVGDDIKSHSPSILLIEI